MSFCRRYQKIQTSLVWRHNFIFKYRPKMIFFFGKAVLNNGISPGVLTLWRHIDVIHIWHLFLYPCKEEILAVIRSNFWALWKLSTENPEESYNNFLRSGNIFGKKKRSWEPGLTIWNLISPCTIDQLNASLYVYKKQGTWSSLVPICIRFRLSLFVPYWHKEEEVNTLVFNYA